MLVKMIKKIMAIAAKMIMPAVEALPIFGVSDGGIEK